MIASCIIFLATFSSMDMPDDYYISEYMNCKDNVPQSMYQYSDLFYRFFDEENIETAVKIGWCESRGKQFAFRKSAHDSGVMQFVSWTWNWVAEEYDLPLWNTWVITRHGEPYTEEKVYTTDIGFEHLPVQFSPYYNIQMASILAEDIYNRTQWRDWNSSKWCWEDTEQWKERWKRENA